MGVHNVRESQKYVLSHRSETGRVQTLRSRVRGVLEQAELAHTYRRQVGVVWGLAWGINTGILEAGGNVLNLDCGMIAWCIHLSKHTSL